MRRIVKSELDKFYTKESIAKYFIEKINFNEYDLVIDPSCGDGAFYSNISFDNKIGIDISPDIDGVITSDFLEWEYDLDVERDKVIVITNPPFGKQGSLAMDFIKKATEFSDTIAMILPVSFMKPSVKNRIPEYYHLEYEERLLPNSFLLEGNDYEVKCVFQIWKRMDYKREKIVTQKPVGFSYVKREDSPDLSIRRVGVYAGKAFKDNDKSEQSHYFIKLDERSRIDHVIYCLNLITWVDETVGPRSISKYELNKALNFIINGHGIY